MGINTAFSDGANFSRMIEGKSRLKISNVVHKAFIKVNENGTEAAAASGSVIAAFSLLQPKPMVIKADHPFMYFISDCNDVIYFIGHFYGNDA